MATLSQPPDDGLPYDRLGPAAYVIPVPLIVLARCDPRQLMVWVALRWIAEVFPELEPQGGPSYHLLARLCKIDRRSLPAIVAQLREHQLVHHLGLRRVARARAARPHYVIDADHVDALTRRHFAAILARWQLPSSRLPRQVPREHLALLTTLTGASGISSVPATGAWGISSAPATGASGISPAHPTGASGISPTPTTGASGISPAEEQFAVSVTGDTPYMTIFVPLVVFDRCDPSELATWMAQCWLLTVQADRPTEIRAAQVAQIGTVGRGKLRAYYERLLDKRLLIHVGTARAARNYVISQHRLLLLNAQEAGPILTRWNVPDRAPYAQPSSYPPLRSVTGAAGITPACATGTSGITVPLIPQHDGESTGAFGISPTDTRGASGITPTRATGAAGITPAAGPAPLKRKNLTKRIEKESSPPVVAPPDGHPPLQAHPFELWQRLHPEATAADRERLRRSAAEHDLPQGAYGGGFGLYWLGRAIEAALTKTDQTPTLRYVRGVLRSWRARTTDQVSAYGWDAPTYTRHPPRPRPAAVAAPVPAPSAELVSLWQQILGQLQAQLERAAFATWLQDSVLVALDDGTAVVAVPNIFVREHVAETYAADLAAALAAALTRPIAVEVVIGGPAG